MIENERDLLGMSILVVDDEPAFLEIIRMLLELRGYTNITTATDGEQVLQLLEERRDIDLILTDVRMPKLDGIALLERVKGDPNWRSIPVIMNSGLGEMDNVIKCIGRGAEDYLMKPIEKELLWARVHMCLERKFLRDREKELHQQVQAEKEKSESVLYNVLPRRIAERLRNGDLRISEKVNNASVLFTDLVKFTRMSAELEAHVMVGILNEMFLRMDRLAIEHGIEKIKTVGDSYMGAAGLDGQDDHADRCVRFGLAAIEEIRALNEECEVDVRIRVGVSTGSVIAGVIGSVRPMYDIWGQTVNVASRMESHGLPDRVQITQMTRLQLETNHYGFSPRGVIDVKGVGKMETYMSPDPEVAPIPMTATDRIDRMPAIAV